MSTPSSPDDYRPWFAGYLAGKEYAEPWVDAPAAWRAGYLVGLGVWRRNQIAGAAARKATRAALRLVKPGDHGPHR